MIFRVMTVGIFLLAVVIVGVPVSDDQELAKQSPDLVQDVLILTPPTFIM